jgi:hypothetical protein
VSKRERLSNRRASLIFDVEAMGLRFTASVSRFPDGRLAELFMDNHKAGSAVGTIAIALSFALQHGADLEVIRRALCRDGQGRPLGPLGRALDLILDGAESAP